jgi:hypothetical protein
VLQAAITWISEKIITEATVKILSFLDPSGIMAVVNSIIAIYRAIQSFLQYVREMMEIVNSVALTASSIARGVLDVAATGLENALASAMPIAIGFLANQVGLGNLGERIGEIIEAVRERINAAIDWLIDTAMRAGTAFLGMLGMGGAADTPGAQGAADVDYPAPVPFENDLGERHTLFIRLVSGTADVTIRSDPQSLESFLAAASQSDAISDERKARIPEAETIVVEIETLCQRLAALGDSDPPSPQVVTVQRDIMSREQQLALILRALVAGISAQEFDQRYLLEGHVAAFNAMPVQTNDKMTPDHQPQNAILEHAAELPIFNAPGINTLRQVAAGRSQLAWTINLHENRHRQGRTYGGRGTGTKNRAVAAITAAHSHHPKDADQQRLAVIGVFRTELMADVAAMIAVAQRPATDPVWNDISATQQDKETFVARLRSTIVTGERRIANQDLDRLAR